MCESDAKVWLEPMVRGAELHCEGGAKLDFFEKWTRRNVWCQGAPDRTIIVFYTTNDLANRKREVPGLRQRIAEFAKALRPWRRVFVILGGPSDLWQEYPEYDVHVQTLKGEFDRAGILCYVGHELYYALHRFKADRRH